jgi:hypothetical protein
MICLVDRARTVLTTDSTDYRLSSGSAKTDAPGGWLPESLTHLPPSPASRVPNCKKAGSGEPHPRQGTSHFELSGIPP